MRQYQNGFKSMTQTTQTNLTKPKNNTVLSLQIDNMLDYSQLLMKKFVMHPNILLIDRLIKDITKFAERELSINSANNAGRVTFSSLKGLHVPPTIHIDRDRLFRIISCLITNSVKYTRVGTIKLSIMMFPEKDELEIAVSDTGCGMTESQIKNLFSIKTNKEQVHFGQDSSGIAGLGLTVAQMLCKEMGSELKVKSRINIGSMFSFGLAMQEFFSVEDEKVLNSFEENKINYVGETKKIRSISNPSPTMTSANNLVIVVDDVELNRFVLLEMVKKFGVAVRIATNGIEAVAEYEKETDLNPKAKILIFMDLNMPLMDGIQATVRIRALNRNRPAIIAATAFASEEEREKCFKVGFDDFLSKPINTKKIEDLLKKFFLS